MCTDLQRFVTIGCMENHLNEMSPEKKNRLAYIDGREDLFETKLFLVSGKSKSPSKSEQNGILVVSRDPGSANALVPVLEILHEDPMIKMNILTDGRAQEIFQKKFKTTDIMPKGLKNMVLEADIAIDKPVVLFIDPSQNEQGLETYAGSTFDDVPIVLLEDYYGSSLKYLKRLKESKLKLPEKVCVMDEGAKKIILTHFPELVNATEVTGQPAFDRFALENTKMISDEVRKQLGIDDNEQLITFMSSLEGVDFVKAFAASLVSLDKTGLKFVFRRHPRDNITYEEYEKIFKEKGISLLKTNQIETNDIGAASDLIITSTSTEALNAIYRRKPVLNIIDKKLDIYASREIPVSVELGASVGISDIIKLPEMLPELLNQQSELNSNLKKNMTRYYMQDGKNAQRVAAIVQQVIASQSQATNK